MSTEYLIMQLFRKKEHLLNEWIKGARENDSRSQKAIYDMLSPKMYAVCLRYMGDRDSAADVLQDGFVTLFSKIGTYLGEGSFEGWARRIFVTTSLMALRKHDVLRQSDDVEMAYGVFDESATAVQDIGYKELLKLVAELPVGFRTVFNLYVMEGYSHKEIAQSLGIEEVTSRSQLQRARVMLQNKIKNRH